jgi:hypothetical protein
MKVFFTIMALLYTVTLSAQTPYVAPTLTKAAIGNSGSKPEDRITERESDTSKENQEPQYFYLTVSANTYVNTTGGFAKRFSPSIEFGRTYGIFDIGLATGRLNSFARGSDTTLFLELRPTINVFSKGRFSESLCLGMGAVFGAQQGLMTEICNSINFNISENVAVAISQGYCFFDGANNNRSTQYMGFNLTYNFLRDHSVNKQRKKKTLVGDE